MPSIRCLTLVARAAVLLAVPAGGLWAQQDSALRVGILGGRVQVSSNKEREGTLVEVKPGLVTIALATGREVEIPASEIKVMRAWLPTGGSRKAGREGVFLGAVMGAVAGYVLPHTTPCQAQQFACVGESAQRFGTAELGAIVGGVVGLFAGMMYTVPKYAWLPVRTDRADQPDDP